MTMWWKRLCCTLLTFSTFLVLIQCQNLTLEEYISESKCQGGVEEREDFVVFNGSMEMNYMGPNGDQPAWKNRATAMIKSPGSEEYVEQCVVDCDDLKVTMGCFCELEGNAAIFFVGIPASLVLQGSEVYVQRSDPDGKNVVKSEVRIFPKVYGEVKISLKIDSKAVPLYVDDCVLQLQPGKVAEVALCQDYLQDPYELIQELTKNRQETGTRLETDTVDNCETSKLQITEAHEGQFYKFSFKEEAGCFRENAYACKIQFAYGQEGYHPDSEVKKTEDEPEKINSGHHTAGLVSWCTLFMCLVFAVDRRQR